MATQSVGLVEWSSNKTSEQGGRMGGNLQNVQVTAKLSEKTLQELRYIAYEYVKQIVAKANELSQNKTLLTNEYQQPRPNGKCATPQDNCCRGVLMNPANRGHIHQVAVQINKQFKFSQKLPKSQTQGQTTLNKETAKDQQPAGRIKTVTYQESRGKQPELPASNQAHSLVRDYIEQDYATMSSSQDESESMRYVGVGGSGSLGLANIDDGGGASRSPIGKSSGANNRQKATIQAAGGGGSTSAKSFRNLHERLNWHLLVSCFSTCLPEELTRQNSATTSSSTTTRRAPGGPSAV